MSPAHGKVLWETLSKKVHASLANTHVTDTAVFCFPALQEYEHKPYERIKVDFSLSDCKDTFLPTHQAVDWDFHTPEEEIRCVRDTETRENVRPEH